MSSSTVILKQLWQHYQDNPPEDVEIEKLKLTAAALQYLEEKQPAFPKTYMPVDKTMNLHGEEIVVQEYVRMQGGIITMFEKAEVYGSPREAISYWLYKKRRRKAFGEFVGFVYGEYPLPFSHVDAIRVRFAFTIKEPHIEERKARRRWLKKKGVTRTHYDVYLKGNTLKDFESGRAEYNIWKKLNHGEWRQKMRERRIRLAEKKKQREPEK